MNGMVVKGRSVQGEKHHKAEVREIRNRENEPRVTLAKEFNVSDCTIRDIVKGRSWKHA